MIFKNGQTESNIENNIYKNFSLKNLNKKKLFFRRNTESNIIKKSISTSINFVNSKYDFIKEIRKKHKKYLKKENYQITEKTNALSIIKKYNINQKITRLNMNEYKSLKKNNILINHKINDKINILKSYQKELMNSKIYLNNFQNNMLKSCNIFDFNIKKERELTYDKGQKADKLKFELEDLIFKLKFIKNNNISLNNKNLELIDQLKVLIKYKNFMLNFNILHNNIKNQNDINLNKKTTSTQNLKFSNISNNKKTKKINNMSFSINLSNQINKNLFSRKSLFDYKIQNNTLIIQEDKKYINDNFEFEFIKNIKGIPIEILDEFKIKNIDLSINNINFNDFIFIFEELENSNLKIIKEIEKINKNINIQKFKIDKIKTYNEIEINKLKEIKSKLIETINNKSIIISNINSNQFKQIDIISNTYDSIIKIIFEISLNKTINFEDPEQILKCIQDFLLSNILIFKQSKLKLNAQLLRKIKNTNDKINQIIFK